MIVKQLNCDSTFRNPKFYGSLILALGETYGENVECKIVLGEAQQSDSGSWNCKLSQCKRIQNGGCLDPNGSGVTAEATRTVRVNHSLLCQSNIQ